MAGLAVLILRAGAHLCALPVAQVIETMRPLPVEPVGGAPAFVRGVSVIRGAPTPVLDLEGLLDGSQGDKTSRYVALRGEKPVALAVEEVLNLKTLEADTFEKLPSLLSRAEGAPVEALGVLDAHLLVLLQTAKLVPADTWEKWTSPARNSRSAS